MPETTRPDATLPQGCTSHFDLLRTAKRAGRRFGLGPQDLQLLELYLSCTRREDWAEGRRPLYTRSVRRTAALLGVSPRSINTSERRLERLGLIRRDTRADGARGGWGGEDGGPLYGIDLTPLIAAQTRLTDCADAAAAEIARAESLRARISRLLGEARRIAATFITDDITTLFHSLPNRTPQGRNPEALQACLESVEATICNLRTLCEPVLCRPVDNSTGHPDSSGASDESGPLLYNTISSPIILCRPGTGFPAPTIDTDSGKTTVIDAAHGIQHLRTRDISRVMPDIWHTIAGTLPGQFLWHRFAMAAETRLQALAVPEAAWLEAVAVMGRQAAALSLMILDTNRHRPDNPVRNVAGALRAMTRRAERGTLRLHASVYGLLARDREEQAA